MRDRILIILLLVFLFGLFAVDLARPINLTAVDIGRHVKNGELLLQGQWGLLHRNFYSFTHPDYPFINHHWLFGVLSYGVYQCAGFVGLSIVYIGVLLGALFFFLRAAALRGQNAAGMAVFFAFLSLPILADRREIRPEGLSLLFMGLYFYLLTKLSLGHLRQRTVFIILGIAQVIWVNTHIFFFMGPLLTVIFLWEGYARKCSVCVRVLWPLLVLLLTVGLINPSGLAGALTPLNIFKEFGYRLAENQTGFFMMDRFPDRKEYAYYLGLVLVAIVGIILAVRARGWKINAPFILLAAFAACAGLKAVRLMTPFAFFLVPLGAFFYGQAEGKLPPKTQKTVRVFLLAAALVLGVIQASGLRNSPIGVGLAPGVNVSAEFFKQTGIQGPVFSNYDIGGYLIYHLYGREPVFVDNRQEAFPPEFFKGTYVPIQEDKEAWKKADGRWGFNAVYFYRHDLTPWGQSFLVRLVDDPDWAPVFVDGYTIIFLKRNGPNQRVIDRFQLPRSMFSVSGNAGQAR